MRDRRSTATLSVVGVVALVATACGGSSTSGSSSANAAPPVPKIAMAQSVGAGEGSLDLINWAGYAEDGTNDKSVDWVHPFQKATGCIVHDKIGNTSDEMVQLMKTGRYDGVSASGDATLRLVYGSQVAPVNTSLVPNYATIQEFLKNRSWNAVNGQMYGIPHGWGANLLMWNTKVVKTAPTSWGVVFDANSPYKGKVTAYDSPIYIADAALYLMKHQPDLGIKDPYALDADQLQEAVDLLKKQKEHVSEYWSDYLREVQAFKTGDSVIGTTWQVIASVAEGEKAPVDAVLPDEGSTGWSDTWMVASKAAHPNCAYAWMDYITSPKAQAAVAEYFGEAPANTKACSLTTDKSFCDTYHAEDAAYAEKIHYWTTPIEQCLDGRTDVKCTNYGDWTTAWTEVKG